MARSGYGAGAVQTGQTVQTVEKATPFARVSMVLTRGTLAWATASTFEYPGAPRRSDASWKASFFGGGGGCPLRGDSCAAPLGT